MNENEVFDFVVIGSGFGGSVSAFRLAEKGYSVLVIEKGKRWSKEDFPNTNWNIKKYLWMPALRLFGIQKLDFFKEVFILSGVGVGGGSLVYANTHMMPNDEFYNHPIWSGFKNWKVTLEPFYEKAKFMLGSSKFEKEYYEDIILKEVAKDMNRESSYKAVDYVGVYLGDPNIEKDPYFNGLGPLRKGCTECAACMVGCKVGAKNTLDKNYLYLAENLYGAKIVSETNAEKIEFKDDIYYIETVSSTSFFSSPIKVFKARNIVFSGGVLGTLELLFKQKQVYKTLTGISDKLGEHILTNSEMLSGILGAKRKVNHGLAISRVFEPDDDTHIETVKFPDGSGMMARLGVIAAGNGNPMVRTTKMLANMILHPYNTFRSYFNFNLSRYAIILLIMQKLENSMKLNFEKSFFGWKLKFDNSNESVPSFIPKGQEVLYRYAEKVNGVPHNAITEVMFNMSTTAHILGGCPMGKTVNEGVVDDNFKVHGLKNAWILDGSIIPCNLGVNPSLTITAISEYAMSKIPDKENKNTQSLDYHMSINKN